MIDDDMISALKKRYENLNPLVFQRSLEKSESALELFEILDSVPKPPFSWDDSSKRWIKISDFYFINKAKSILKKEQDVD
jgi:hypothetical protein